MNSEQTFVEKVNDPKRPYKAIASMVVAAAAYLVGVVPAEGGFGDLSVVQWLGLVLFIGAGFGVTYQITNPEAVTVVEGNVDGE